MSKAGFHPCFHASVKLLFKVSLDFNQNKKKKQQQKQTKQNKAKQNKTKQNNQTRNPDKPPEIPYYVSEILFYVLNVMSQVFA
jgi:hypothetical protein